MKRFVCAVLCMAMLVCALCGTASISYASNVATGKTGNLTWYYYSQSKFLYICGNGTMPLYSTSPWKNYDVRTVDIGGGVQSVGDYAFAYFTNLESVAFNTNMKAINYNAFIGCTKLKTVYYTGSIAQWRQVKVIAGNTAISSAIVVYNCGQTIESPFTDLPYDRWYSEACLYCYNHNIMNGTSGNQFSPSTTLTRAQVVQMLCNLSGTNSSVYAKSSHFSDVSNSSWYHNAVEWAYATGIAKGTGSGFSPNATITRQDLATMLYNYAKYDGISVSHSANISKYTDASSVSSYAQAAIKWAIADGIMGGTTATTLAPKATATRAQAAVIFSNFDRLSK